MNLSNEERTIVALEAQAKLLRWLAGLLVSFLVLGVGALAGFILTETRTQATQDAKIEALEKIVKEDHDQKLSRQEHLEFSQQVLQTLSEIKVEQGRQRDLLLSRVHPQK